MVNFFADMFFLVWSLVVFGQFSFACLFLGVSYYLSLFMRVVCTTCTVTLALVVVQGILCHFFSGTFDVEIKFLLIFFRNGNSRNGMLN